MRNLKNVVLLLVTLTLAACSGLSARQKALLPAMQLAWHGVSADVGRGIEESVAVAPPRLDAAAAELQRKAVVKLGDAIEAGDHLGVAGVVWNPLAQSAEFGFVQRIAKNEISAGVAGSLRERLSKFGESLVVFLERR